MENVYSSNSQAETAPRLRFPGFVEKWEARCIGELYAERGQRGLPGMELLSVTMRDGVVPRAEIEGKDNSSDDKSHYKAVRKGDMVYNSMRMWQGASGISAYDGIVSPAYTVLRPVQSVHNGFMAALFKNPGLVNEFRKNSRGLTSDTWNLKYPQIRTIRVRIPCLPEQTRIAELLDALNRRIDSQRRLIETLKTYKRGVIARYFETRSDAGWKRTTIANCLSYEQPQKYIVNSEQYQNSYPIPVLTANKAFILGYTDETDGVYDKGEVILYDDFTMEVRFVDFPFKVKSSTIKLLTPRDDMDLYFLFTLLQGLGLKPAAHQRSYISVVEPMEIAVPCYAEQTRAAKLFRLLARRVNRQRKLLQELQRQKAALLQQLFI